MICNGGISEYGALRFSDAAIWHLWLCLAMYLHLLYLVVPVIFHQRGTEWIFNVLAANNVAIVRTNTQVGRK